MSATSIFCKRITVWGLILVSGRQSAAVSWCSYMFLNWFNSIIWLLFLFESAAKNPPPACITVNRYFGVKMCAKMTNVFLSGRNVHACLEMEGFWDDEPAFNYPFNCFRFGSEGVAVVRPEDGGGDDSSTSR